MNEEEMIKSAGPRGGASRERAERVREKVHAEWSKRYSVRPRWFPASGWTPRTWSLAAAAIVLLAIGVALWPRLGFSPSRPVEAAIVEVSTGDLNKGQQILTGISVGTLNGRVALRLKSGASLRLDDHTAIRFQSPAVLELSRGAVYYDSGEAQGGIEIVTAIGTVRDIGTQFEVRLAGEAMSVRVRKGTAETRRTRVEAGTELRVDRSGQMIRRSLPADHSLWNWILEVSPPFELEGATLAEFLDWAGAELGLQLRYGDSVDAGGIVLHGSIQGLRPDQALQTVLPTTGLTTRRSPGVLLVE